MKKITKKANKTIHHIPRVRDDQLTPPSRKRKKVGDTRDQAENIGFALKAFNDIKNIDGDNLTVSWRERDENGKWYFGVAVISLDRVKPGDEFVLNSTKFKKLVVK